MATPTPDRDAPGERQVPSAGDMAGRSSHHARHSVIREEDQLDWLEHLQRSPKETRRLDLILIALTLLGVLILYLTVHFARHLLGH